MKILYTSLLFLMNCVLSVAQPEIIVPKPHQLKWHEAEMGAVFHYDLHVFDGIRYGQGNNRISPIEDYNIFNPTQLDTDQWIQAAKAAGCKFAVLTATHETGFGLWQSDVNPYCLKAVKWRDGKGDIVRDFVNSCRKYGIQPGIYVGIRWNSLLGIHNFKVAGDGEFAANRQAWYKRFCEKMVEELCTRYGDLYMIWFDGGADDPRGDGPDVEPIVNKYQPNCLFYHNIDRADFRWGGSETGTVGYPCWSTFPAPCSHHKRIENQKDQIALLKQGDPEGKYWVPAMADSPLRGANGRHEWFWEPDDENNIYPLTTLMDMYEKSVGRNATLIIGLTPDPDGLLPAGDEQRLKEWGEEINRRFGTPLAETQGRRQRLTLNLNEKQPVIDNLVICINQNAKDAGQIALMTDHIADLHFNGDTQCFPRWLPGEQSKAAEDTLDFGEPSEMPSGFSQEALPHFQAAYPGKPITEDDLFYYIYGILHSEDYRTRYANNLMKELPRIPRVATYEQFMAFVEAGQELARLHVHFEDVAPYAGVKIEYTKVGQPSYRVTQMKWGKIKGKTGNAAKDKTTLIYNDWITVKNIPLEAQEYVVNKKSALDWVVERACVSIDKASGIVNDFNDYAAEMGSERYPLDLFLKVITVSLETMKIVKALPKIEIHQLDKEASVD